MPPLLNSSVELVTANFPFDIPTEMPAVDPAFATIRELLVTVELP